MADESYLTVPRCKVLCIMGAKSQALFGEAPDQSKVNIVWKKINLLEAHCGEAPWKDKRNCIQREIMEKIHLYLSEHIDKQIGIIQSERFGEARLVSHL